jgi:hypothetical protein
MGIGATYRSFTLNLAYGFPFINADRGRGETKYLDLQAHFYGRKSNIDLFGQFYNGLYLSPKGYGRSDGNYYVRPDLRLREFGGSYQYIFNNKRFSFRSSVLQNEWQQRSAGALLVGGEFFIGQASADSSVFPVLSMSEARPNTNALRFYELGPSVGYAYTLVVARHFFITGSISLAADYSYSEFEGPKGTISEYGFNPNSMLRLFAGYNSDRSAFSITFTNSRVNIDSQKTSVFPSIPETSVSIMFDGFKRVCVLSDASIVFSRSSTGKIYCYQSKPILPIVSAQDTIAIFEEPIKQSP